jgi:hypothetical protein
MPARPLILSPLLLCLGAAACGDLPGLADAPGVTGPPPVILPLDQVIAGADAGAATPAAGDDLTARAAALRARAAAMQ